MKKTLFTLLAVAVVVTGFAQAQFAIGLKGGPNFARFDVNNAGESFKNKAGFHLGAYTLLKLGKVGIQPEIIFSQQGSKFTFNNQDLKSNFSYVNIPVMLKTYLVAGLNLQIGPQFGFLTEAGGDVIDNTGEVRPVNKDLFKKSDLSIGLGAGWDLPFGLTVDARYNLGVSQIEDDASLNATKNQVIQISVGYKLIKLGK
jgi:hypothetical protein